MRDPVIIFSVENSKADEEVNSLANLSVTSTMLAETTPYIELSANGYGIGKQMYIVNVEDADLVRRFCEVYNQPYYMMVDNESKVTMYDMYTGCEKGPIGKLSPVTKEFAKKQEGFLELQGNYFTMVPV